MILPSRHRIFINDSPRDALQKSIMSAATATIPLIWESFDNASG
jgi:hypothetical protein